MGLAGFLDAVGGRIIWVKQEVEKDLAVVLFRVCSRTSVCLSAGDHLVEEAADVIAFVATGDKPFIKTFVCMIVSFSHEQRVKFKTLCCRQTLVRAQVDGQSGGYV